MSYNIRPAKSEDIQELVRLCAAHAAYEQADYDPAGKAERLAKDLFGSQPKLHCLVAEVDGAAVGYATYMFQYATWDAAEYVYMDCLYLDEAQRSKGIGAALVDTIKAAAAAGGSNLIQWQTPDFNVRAIKFYKRIGAYGKSKERFFLDVEV